MTVKIPKLSLADKLLRILGKKRGVIMPSEKNKEFGPYSTFIAQKESFIRAIFRSNSEPLPDGMTDLFMLNDDERNSAQNKD